MNLLAVFSPDRRTLTILADEEARTELRELGEEIGADKRLWEAFERLIANSELEWIDPVDSGDLTDAPILGIVIDRRLTGTRIAERWGYLDYMLKSPLMDLRDTGRAVFTAP